MNTALYTRFTRRLYHACLKYNPNFISVVFSVSVNLRMQLSAHVARSHRPCTLSIRFARSLRRPSTSSAPSVSSARSPLTSFTLAYESAPPPTHVCYIIRPVSRHIVHSSLLHRLRCPSPSASSALFVRPHRPSTSPALIVVHLLRLPHLLCLLSSSVPMHFHDHFPFSGHFSPRTARHNRRAKNTTH